MIDGFEEDFEGAEGPAERSPNIMQRRYGSCHDLFLFSVTMLSSLFFKCCDTFYSTIIFLYFVLLCPFHTKDVLFHGLP